MYCTTSIVERKEVFLSMKPSMVYVDLRSVGRHYVRTHFVKLVLICLPGSLQLGSPEIQGSAVGCRGFWGTKIHNAGRVLLSVLNLCVRIKIRMATFDTNHSITDSTQSVAASIHKLPDALVKSVSTTRHGQSRCVWQISQVTDRFEVSCWFLHVMYIKCK